MTAMALDTREEWLKAAEDALIELAASGKSFTADDLRAVVGPAPHGGLTGGVFAAARKAGLIRRTLVTRGSKVPSRNHSLLRVWVGVA